MSLVQQSLLCVTTDILIASDHAVIGSTSVHTCVVSMYVHAMCLHNGGYRLTSHQHVPRGGKEVSISCTVHGEDSLAMDLLPRQGISLTVDLPRSEKCH